MQLFPGADLGLLFAEHPLGHPPITNLVTRLLKPDGLYIDLAFPLGKRAGGSPFAVSVPEILSLFHERGFNLSSRETPTDSVSRRRGAEELLILQKARKPL
jgi:hypothetical protein